MEIVAISDTHNKHDQVKVTECDLLLHSGDISGLGTITEITNFLYWFNQQPAKHKVFIAGNHDWGFDELWHKEKIAQLLASYPDVHYLQDSGIQIEGVNIWGSPQTPWFYNWAFNRQRGADIKKYWDMIPSNTDILLTHGPAYGFGDLTLRDKKAVGCVDLWNRLLEIQPKLHIFGHIHEGVGMYTHDKWYTGINASVVNHRYDVVNDPVKVKYEDFL